MVAFIDILKNTLLITGLVMIMMLLIEYINVVSHGSYFKNLQHSKFKQVVVAALLGLVPGCIGGFAAVSLFTHEVINFGALTAAMIASSGDEAFVMFATIPKTAILINILLFIIAVVVGMLVNKLVKRSPLPHVHHHLHIHQCDVEHAEGGSIRGNFIYNMKHLSFQRAILMAGIAIFVVFLASGMLEHDHTAHIDDGHAHTAIVQHEGHTHEVELDAEHHQEHVDLNFMFNERWLNLLFAGLGIVTFIIIGLVKEHFLEEHLWGHIIKKHFVKIFCWTFGALLCIHLLMQFVDVKDWISNNQLIVLFIAILIGVIPESGPHMVFITLFASGNIPFSILLANTIVQDGHSGLPLLAESKKSFFLMKGISALVGLLVGIMGILFHY